MPVDSKTQDEWQYLHSFKRLCHDFPSGEIRKHEGPDFLIKTVAGHTIGIEIGRVYKDYSKTAEQSVEATKEAITVAARAYCDNVLKSPPAFVSLYFTLSRHLYVIILFITSGNSGTKREHQGVSRMHRHLAAAAASGRDRTY
jgi:hypothetical protein